MLTAGEKQDLTDFLLLNSIQLEKIHRKVHKPKPSVSVKINEVPFISFLFGALGLNPGLHITLNKSLPQSYTPPT